jgi:hypothetical protein
MKLVGAILVVLLCIGGFAQGINWIGSWNAKDIPQIGPSAGKQSDICIKFEMKDNKITGLIASGTCPCLDATYTISDVNAGDNNLHGQFEVSGEHGSIYLTATDTGGFTGWLAYDDPSLGRVDLKEGTKY